MLQHRLVQAQIRHRAFELGVLLLELLQPADLDHTPPGELRLPAIERGLRHPQLAADFLDANPVSAWRSAKAICSSEYRFRFMASPPAGFRMPEKFSLQTDQFHGSGPF